MELSALRRQALFAGSALFVGAAALLMAACGGGGDDSPAAAATAGGNRAPLITGSPSASVMSGTAYSFLPAASDPDGDSVSFSVSGMPAWATFDTATGRLQGTPTSSQVGAYANISITVTDGKLSASLPTFTIQVVATTAGTVTLSWMPPTQNQDGTALTDLAGYKVYWGTSQGNYPHSATLTNPGLATYVVEQLTPATWFFVITSLNAGGTESVFSNMASKNVL